MYCRVITTSESAEVIYSVLSLINEVLIEDTAYGFQWPHVRNYGLPPQVRIKRIVLVDFAQGQALGKHKPEQIRQLLTFALV